MNELVKVFIGELLGTGVMIFLGNAVVANVLLSKTKGNQSGLIVIIIGWAVAVFAGVIVSTGLSNSHLNPIVTIALDIDKVFNRVPVNLSLSITYIFGQVIGAGFGQFFVWAFYRDHYKVTENKDLVAATFCTSSAIKNNWNNFLSEALASFTLILLVLRITTPSLAGSFGALPVSLIVLGIGASLDGTTGYAINPARDLAPRVILTWIYGKKMANWSYAWIPVVGPIVGAIIAVIINHLLIISF